MLRETGLCCVRQVCVVRDRFVLCETVSGIRLWSDLISLRHISHGRVMCWLPKHSL